MTVLRSVDLGSKPDDGQGDTLRIAFEKVNGNFDAVVELLLERMMEHPAFAPILHDHAGYVPRFVMDRAPDVPSPVFGAIWVDVPRNEIYLATGTETADQWRRIAFAE
ncbi:hypothetical protein [Afifella sp. IM 167]|uniref:hypothetical protein n=1 Tax=Afifella sp. IM 167 TaxID=2033586 RepID=UPI001CC91D4B|nr:hypothetical protein [Afifella sp. IM 167]MBZ8133273.1 hypothetical protein [Afifella sp. IM 167]